MLSVNYISNFLNNKQCKIHDKPLNTFESKNIFKEDEIKTNSDIIDDRSNKFDKLPYDLKYFFKDDLNNFSVNKKLESKNEIYCFFNCLMTIGDSNFIFYNYNEKKNIIKELIKKMNDDLFLNDLYFKFNYTKNKYFNKEKLLKTLIDGYHLKVDENINLLKKYASDYLGINVFIIQCIDDLFDKNYKEYYISNKYGYEYNNKLSHYLILKEKDCYYPILKNNTSLENYLDYEQIKKYFNEFESFYKINNEIAQIINNNKNDISNMKKMKIDELRNECKKYNIDTTKLSEKTNKPINKLKNELVEELLKVI